LFEIEYRDGFLCASFLTHYVETAATMSKWQSFWSSRSTNNGGFCHSSRNL